MKVNGHYHYRHCAMCFERWPKESRVTFWFRRQRGRIWYRYSFQRKRMQFANWQANRRLSPVDWSKVESATRDRINP